MAQKFYNPFMPDVSLRPDGMVYGGKGGGGVVEKPVYTPPPAAPNPVEAATQEDAITPEEEAMRKREATKQGAKSLQIPVSGAGATGTVGTGNNTQG